MKRKIIISSTILLVIILLIAAVAIVNGKGESKKTEIVITKEQINYQKVNSKDDDVSEKEIVNQLFKEEVLKKECEKRKIELDEETISKIKEQAKGELSYQTLKEIASIGMTEKEFRDILFDRLVSMQKEFILKDQITEEIANNDVKVNDKDFKKKVDEFNKIMNVENASEFEDLVLKSYDLIEEYIEILEKDYVQKVQE